MADVVAGADFEAALFAILGPGRCDVSPEPSRYTGYGGLAGGRPRAVVTPGTQDEAAAVVRLCLAHRIGMVPQGGLTGLAGGGIPTPGQAGSVVMISLGGMNAIRSIDPMNRSIAADAGCTVSQVDEAAGKVGLCFPFQIGSGQSAQVGGILSTNAGGIRSWRHGTARQLTLGVEAVLANGTCWTSMQSVRKANVGLAMGELLIGGEGVLGIITGAVLVLAPRPRRYETALLALPDLEAVAPLFRHLESCGPLDACELMSRTGLALLQAIEPCRALPGEGVASWYALTEWASPDENADMARRAEDAVADAIARGLVLDAVFARSARDRADLWRLRERHGAACRRFGQPMQHDVAVPISAIAPFMKEAMRIADTLGGEARAVPICHVGDGNIHFDLLPPDTEPAVFAAQRPALRRAIHDLAVSLGGSFSAEHGIGTERADELRRLTTPEAYRTMRSIKDVLDPLGLMNPDKVFC